MSETQAPIYGDRYVVERTIARGGMGTVFQALDQRLDRQVAVKVLLGEYAAKPEFLARFDREAKASAGMQHPNIARVFDYGHQAAVPYIVMEYISGRTLRAILDAEGPVLPETAAELAAAVADGLQYAHERGIVHRDVKPGNILIEEPVAVVRDSVKVTDFGIAQLGQDDNQLTQAGAVVGTASYMSPEQALGKGADARSDVYALGCVLYEMLCGQTPFDGENPVVIATKQVRETPAATSMIRPGIPEALDRIVAMAMAKDPDARYQTAAAMRDDLYRFLQGMNPVAGAPATAVIPAATGAVVNTMATAPEPERRKGGWVVPTLAAIAAVLAVGLGVFLLLQAFAGNAKVEVPNVEGAPLAQAVATLTKAGFTTDTRDEASSKPLGTVLSQEPGAGEKAPQGSKVTLVVSSGPVPTTTTTEPATTSSTTTTTKPATTTTTKPATTTTTTTSTTTTSTTSTTTTSKPPVTITAPKPPLTSP